MKFIIKKEIMGGDWYWMIYRKSIFGSIFWERWNTSESAAARLKELNDKFRNVWFKYSS